MAKLTDAIEAVPEGDGRGQDVSRLIRASGLQIEAAYVAGFVDRGRMLHELRGAFRPLVMSEPDVVQKLASLAHQIEKRSAPGGKWLQDARAVRNMLPEEMWLDHVRRITEVASPYAGYFGVPGEAYLRTMIYLAALLPAADVGSLLTNYALKQCFVTRRSQGIRAEKLGNACVWSLAELPTAPGCPISPGFLRG